MALLRNLEQSLSGLVEGTIGRVFRTEVRPTEIARKLAREMEINKRVSLSRTYAPTDYLVYLSPDDRARYTGVEHSIAEELGAYLLEHARRERLVLVRRPLVEFRTDERLRLGEFGIEARTAPISAEEAPPRADPVVDARRGPAPPIPGPSQRPAPEERARALRPNLDEPLEPAFQPAVPLGADEHAREPEPEPELESIDEAPYEDPYVGDPFGGDASQPDDFGWEDVARDEEPPQPDVAPVAGDWLDPVDDWAPELAAPAPEAPRAPEPPRPQAPPVIPVPAAAAAPWIDPTLSRPQARPPLPPPIIPPRPTDTTLLVDGTPHELRGDRMVLGRSRSADVVISDPSVSRQHAELRRDDRGWYLVDLGSTNGTALNGTPITEPQRLEPGMRLKLGHADAIIEVR